MEDWGVTGGSHHSIDNRDDDVDIGKRPYYAIRMGQFGTSLGLLAFIHLFFFHLSVRFIYHNYVKRHLEQHSYDIINSPDQSGSLGRELPLPVIYSTSHSTLTPESIVHFLNSCLKNPRRLMHYQFIVPSLFALTLTCCLSLLSLLLFEPLEIFSLSARRYVWQFDLILLIILVYCVLPFSFISVCCSQSHHQNASSKSI